MQFQTVREMAALIRSQRKRLGWSQSELATRAGVSRDWVIGLEKGRSTVEFGLVLRALKALGLAMSLDAVPESPSSGGIDLNQLLGDPVNPDEP